ncbi:pyrimidine 5'-nucleotidase [Sneathiella glossodoripedis]|uniref:pyrimidine 5'-nucleotidase n=1 Tax=Sneathiella glossodoripedis TaxID=418853 RepID=UPI0004728510|nr:pyrimidine 5'-nucleotidase [Sneathiella glossodoripedis]
MIKEANWSHFTEIDVWIFDLDNTLYPAHCNLFAQMDVKMGEFVANFLDISYDEAKKLQKQYFSEYGTTLNGLMTCHGLEPQDYLDYVHDIDITHIERDERLNSALEQIDGRKIIFTNASTAHAMNVSRQLGIDHHFEDVFDIHKTNFVPKPEKSVYEQLISDLDINPNRSVFFEDMAKNLKPAHELGMKTVWIPNQEKWSHEQATGDHIHHIAEDLGDWLTELISSRNAI